MLVASLAAMSAAATLPPSVYTAPDIAAQALDYDEANKVFLAHSGWLDGNLVHYYKFRVYAPDNYGTDAGSSAVPIVPVYLPTTDGGLSGIPPGQRPVLAHYPSAGVDAVAGADAGAGAGGYSDFARIHFVTVPANYAANGHKDAAALIAAFPDGVAPSDIFVNAPVVPNGAHLQHPDKTGVPRSDPQNMAPIAPWLAWFEGDEAWTYVFETTDNAFADHINAATRTSDGGLAGSGFEVVVVPGFASASGVAAIPIWHLNQYATGVIPGTNNGGPSPDGQRNVVALDRFDDGYSPLWQLYWITQLPLGYGADDARRAADFGTPDDPGNGFAVAATPVFVNCPAVGIHGGEPVADQGTTVFGVADLAGLDAVRLEGSLVMENNETVRLIVNGEELGTATTGALGAYSFDVVTSFLDRGGNTAIVMHGDDEVAEYALVRGTLPERSNAIVWVVAVAALLVLVYGYSRMRGERGTKDRDRATPELATRDGATPDPGARDAPARDPKPRDPRAPKQPTPDDDA
jgi:hypothetical protein